MDKLPESFLFEIRMSTLLGVTLMTPFFSNILDLLLLKYEYKGTMTILAFLIELILAICGFKMIRKTYHYLRKEALKCQHQQ